MELRRQMQQPGRAGATIEAKAKKILAADSAGGALLIADIICPICHFRDF